MALSDWTILRGPQLPMAALELLHDHVDELRAAWKRLDQGGPVE